MAWSITKEAAERALRAFDMEDTIMQRLADSMAGLALSDPKLVQHFHNQFYPVSTRRVRPYLAYRKVKQRLRHVLKECKARGKSPGDACGDLTVERRRKEDIWRERVSEEEDYFSPRQWSLEAESVKSLRSAWAAQPRKKNRASRKSWGELRRNAGSARTERPSPLRGATSVGE